MLKNEGSNRFRMKNGARISATAWKEQFPEPKYEVEQEVDVEQMQEDLEQLKNLVQKMVSDQNLKRAMYDSANRRLATEPRSVVTHHENEGAIWN